MIDQNEYSEFFQDFLMESTELLEDYEKNLLEIENIFKETGFSFDEIEGNLQSIFRSIHTIKGLAGMMDFSDIKNYTHEAEEILDRARNNDLPLDEQFIDLMFEILDTTKKLIENLMAPGRHHFNMEEEIYKFDKFFEAASGAMTAVEVSEPEPIQGELKKKPIEPIEPEQEEEEEESEEQPQKKPTEVARQQFTSNTIRVDTRRLDNLLDTVGELVIGKNRLIDVSKTLIEWDGLIAKAEKNISIEENAKTDLAETVDQLTRLIETLQESSMKLRMVPIGYTFRKFRRLVRDLARRSNKEVNLKISGETTEVDRAVIESMEDPILHIIRNAIDHGIEKPEERIKKGKPPEGNLKLSAFQQNNSIVIHITDDGKGIDPESVYQKALDKGIIDPSLQLTKKDILNMVFLPGFSTAEKVTDVSGRGVGMDVVKRNILKLNGMIDIESEIDEGTKIIMTLPLTLAIIKVLLVDIGRRTYSIPINNVIETVAVPASQVQYINGREAIKTARGGVLPIVRLDRVLNIKKNGNKDKLFVIIMGIGERQVGFVVDSLVSQQDIVQDIVIKPLGEYLGDIKGISGATILGNGDISLVLDLGSLWEKEISKIEQ